MYVKASIVLATVALVSVCQCKDAILRIKDGSEDVRGDFSLTASIRRKGSHVCTGVLVDRRWLLTLKECINERSLSQYTVRFKPFEGRSSIVKRTVRYIEVPNTDDDSVILARLNKKLRRVRDSVRPFDRFDTSKNGELTSCKAVGYSSNENVLNEVDIEIQPAKACRGSEKKTTLCFDTMEGQLCKVDNGSPIVCKLGKQDKKWHLVGLSSVAQGCKDDYISGIMLSFFRKSIIKTINMINDKPEVDTPTDCGAVPTIPDGSVTLDDPSSSGVGSTATVTCESGFETDSSTIYCQEDGQWTSSTCETAEAALGDPCLNDDQCINANSICNGTCACAPGSFNDAGNCTGCVEGTYDCVWSVNSNQVDECIVCSTGQCLETILNYVSSTDIEVLNPTDCEQTESSTTSDCDRTCQADPNCRFMWTNNINKCIYYSKDCAFRTTQGPTIHTFHFYRGC